MALGRAFVPANTGILKRISCLKDHLPLFWVPLCSEQPVQLYKQCKQFSFLEGRALIWRYLIYWCCFSLRPEQAGLLWWIIFCCPSGSYSCRDISIYLEIWRWCLRLGYKDQSKFSRETIRKNTHPLNCLLWGLLYQRFFFFLIMSLPCRDIVI